MPGIHETLSAMFEAGKFEPFIRHIRFPHFRNLREGTRIEFLHPVTVLVGPNGTNKTAILRALQGCPGNANVGQYWFSTSLDPIRPVDRHRYIHGYLAPSVGEVVEVVKSRITREGDPDYFETARPIIQDGMAKMPPLDPSDPVPPERTRTRWSPITKHVVYLDFRSELSAYDKFFYHLPFRRKAATPTAKKSVIRKRAAHLMSSLVTRRRNHSFYQSERIIRPAVELSVDQTAAISEILGRTYDSIRVISHRYFDVDGATVVLKSFGLQYSEAFAGSGEFAVVMLVKAITEAPERSLILLDEPEVSLHPGAQRNLMAFIANQAKIKRHQVVISTHSPEIVHDLPVRAIKVFQRSDSDGKVELVSQESEPSEAFFRLGVRTAEKRLIFVEDALAKAIVKRAIRPLGQAANARVDIAPLPGGAGAIQKVFVPNFALSGRSGCLVLLDGDQRPPTPAPDPANVADPALETTAQCLLKVKVPLPLNGSSGMPAPGDREAQLRLVLTWAYRYLDFLPGETPDTLLPEMEGTSDEGGDGKAIWVDRTRRSLGRETWEVVTAVEILAEQERALARIDPDCKQLEQIRSRVRLFLAEPI